MSEGEKTGMSNLEYDEYMVHWEYLVSLTEMLERTKYYVHQGLYRGKLAQGDVYSDAFKQIILLASAEFESVGKILCRVLGKKPRTIAGVTRAILENYPKIVEARVYTSYYFLNPLEGWTVIESKKDEKPQVGGLEWWSAYNSIKHERKDAYLKCTLNNATLAVGALYVLNLYLQKRTSANLQIARDNPVRFFKNEYITKNVVASGKPLPGFD